MRKRAIVFGGYVIIALACLSASALAQTVWQKHPTNPVITNGTAGSWDERGALALGMLYDGTTFHMWYSGIDAEGMDNIGYAGSPDGVNWSKHAANPVLGPGESGAWDEGGPGSPSLVYIAGMYHMWYDAVDAGGNTGIGYAISPDGVNWTRQGSGPVLTPGAAGAWDAAAVLNPMVLYDGSVFRMWYSGWDGTNTRIGIATSPDGRSWVKFGGNPVLDTGPAQSWDAAYVLAPAVVHTNGVYHMWYEGAAELVSESPFPNGAAIGYAVSEDGGITWQKHPEPVMEPGAAGSWDDHTIFPEVLQTGDHFRMWYSGYNAESDVWQIGYATSQIPTGIDGEVPGLHVEAVANFPNPFSRATRLSYRLNTGGYVEVAIYDSFGTKVRTLAAGRQEAGTYTLDWDGSDAYGRPLGSAVYQCRVHCAAAVQSCALLLLR